MLRDLIHTAESRVALLASANLSLSGAEGFVAHAEPILHALVMVGQFAVAVVTVIYIVRKSLAIRNEKK